VSKLDRELLDLFEHGTRAPYVEERLRALERRKEGGLMGAVIVARNFGDLRDVMPSTKELMQEIGDFVVQRIRRRTEQEQGYDGQTFQPLSRGYAKQKAKALGTRART
jgi:hypothetical protein